jgi:hypothetical protein
MFLASIHTHKQTQDPFFWVDVEKELNTIFQDHMFGHKQFPKQWNGHL